MPSIIIKSTPQDKEDIQRDVLEVIANKSVTTKQLRKEESMEKWQDKWGNVKLTLYSLCNMGILQNVSIYTQTSGTAYGMTEHGRRYYEIIKDSQ